MLVRGVAANIHKWGDIMRDQIGYNLMCLLKSLNIDKETAVSIAIMAKTDENRQELIWAICDRYEEKGTVTEQDVLKLLLIINGRLKTSTERVPQISR